MAVRGATWLTWREEVGTVTRGELEAFPGDAHERSDEASKPRPVRPSVPKALRRSIREFSEICGSCSESGKIMAGRKVAPVPQSDWRAGARIFCGGRSMNSCGTKQTGQSRQAKKTHSPLTIRTLPRSRCDSSNGVNAPISLRFKRFEPVSGTETQARVPSSKDRSPPNRQSARRARWRVFWEPSLPPRASRG